MARFRRNALLFLAMLAALVVTAWLIGHVTPGGK